MLIRDCCVMFVVCCLLFVVSCVLSVVVSCCVPCVGVVAGWLLLVVC